MSEPEIDSRPAVHLLSNTCYQVLLTEAGTGFSRHGTWSLTRWTADRLSDPNGFFLYLRDLDDGAYFSVGRRPCRTVAEQYRCDRRPGCVVIQRAERGVELRLEICVLPDAPGELRSLRLRDLTGRPRNLEITTFGEVALHHPAAHAGHPAFSRLFVRSAHEDQPPALLFSRRPRVRGETNPWMVHALLDGGEDGYETDRARFLGRGGSPRAPQALIGSGPLSGTVGDVLDPSFSLRTCVQLGPGAEARRTFLLGAAQDRDSALALARALTEPEAVPAAFAAAARREEAGWLALGLDAPAAVRWEQMVGALLYREPGMRRRADLLAEFGGATAERTRVLEDWGIFLNDPSGVHGAPA
jgi:cellobiose phosphorylase